MNSHTPADSRADSIVTAVGILVLLIGTATGNAYVLLIMSLITLVGISFTYRKRFRREMGLVMGIGVILSFVIAAAITRLL